MSYKAKYLKARERFHEFVARNDLLKSELTSVVTDVQELRDEIKALINTIIGTAPEYEPSFTSDEAFEEGLELSGHPEGVGDNTMNGRDLYDEGDNGVDKGYAQRRLDEHDDYETTPRSNRAAPNTHSPHFRQPRQAAAASYSPSPRPQRTNPNGRPTYQSSRRQYEESVDDGFAQDDRNSQVYAENGAISPYNNSRHRSTHRGGDSQFHPYPQASRSSESRSRNGNGHRASNGAAASVVENGSPDSRYSNYSHRSYRN